MSFFDILTDINEKKKMSWEEAKLEYNPWMINKGLSNHIQTVLFSNEMNRLSFLAPDMQWAFYQKGISKGKRFGKWSKPDEMTQIDIISEHFNINKQRAKEYLGLLDETQIKEISERKIRGGKNG